MLAVRRTQRSDKITREERNMKRNIEKNGIYADISGLQKDEKQGCTPIEDRSSPFGTTAFQRIKSYLPREDTDLLESAMMEYPGNTC